MKAIKIIYKAYRVYVHSHIGEYPVFRAEDVEPVYAKDATQAKGKCDLWDATNEHGDKATWIDIKCFRAKEYDKIEYKGQEIFRYELEEVLRKERRVIELNKLPDDEMFYVQDSRNYVGNSVLWWGLGSSGYVTQLDKAQKYTKAEILKDFSNGRETDIIWRANHVEDNIKTHVDIQYLTRDYSY
jgi:hypothetical protein